MLFDLSERYQRIYSELADRPFTPMDKQAFVESVAELCKGMNASSVIEFGCGRGRDADRLFSLLNINILAIDNVPDVLSLVPSYIDRCCIDVASSGFSVPDKFDLGYCAHLVHLLSVKQKIQFYKNAWGCIRPGGVFLCLTASLHELRNRFMSTYMPSAYKIDADRYLSVDANIGMMKEAGFRSFEVKKINLGIRDVGEDVLFLQKRLTSITHLIPKNEFSNGLSAMSRDIYKMQTRIRPWVRTLIIARR